MTSQPAVRVWLATGAQGEGSGKSVEMSGLCGAACMWTSSALSS